MDPRSRVPGGFSLTTKSILVAVSAGALAWVLTDHLAARGAKRAFETHLYQTLTERAVDYRFLFGRSVHAYREAVKVLAGQRAFADHLESTARSAGTAEPLRHERRPPAWLPGRSVLRSLGSPRYALLLDGRGAVREIYSETGVPPPRFLAAPEARLLKLSEEESYLRSEDGVRFVVATKTVRGPGGEVAGSLVIASPIDEEFLRAAAGPSIQGIVTAIVDETTHEVAASSAPESIPPGTRAESISASYLTTLQDFYEYGGSEMDFLFASFISLERIAPASREFIREDRVRRGLQSVLIIGVLTVIVFVIARRIGRVSERVGEFSREALGLAPADFAGGDQITVLEERFQLLAEEVVSSREAIRREAAEGERRAAEIQRKERQLLLLRTVTDAMGVGVMRDSGAGFVPFNERMRGLEAEFHDLGVFAEPREGAEERVLEAPDGRRRVFFLTAPPVLLEEKVVLVSDVTEKREAADRLRQSYETQRVVNEILLIAFEQVPLEEQLARALGQVLTLPWPGLRDTAVIFRLDAETGRLEFAAGRGAGAAQMHSCPALRGASCICSRAAASRRIVFSAADCDLHEGSVAGLPAHGHYCVPIVSGPVLHGVMALFLGPDHQRLEVEEEQLRAIASAVASIFGLSRAEGEKKALFGQLLQAQKMETVGRLAGGVAHDFNNILTAIMGYAELSLLGAGDRGPLAQNLRSVLESCERAQGLTAQLLAFSRTQVLEMRVASLDELVRSAAKILRRLVGEDIAIDIEPGEAVPNVLVDRVQIEQVLFNLVVNARDAMPRGGRIRIRTEAFERGAGPGGPPGTYAVLSVGDTGTGIPPEIRERIFEPFYTTKETGKGTGLGLATAYGIATQHHGFIEVRSELGRGTEFRVYLPTTERPLPPASAAAAPSPGRGSETLLLVEDDEAVRKLFSTYLEPLGYRLLQASSGEEALGLSMFHEGRIDLLVTDVVMPGVNGRELASALRALRPETRVLFISGYVKDARIQEELEAEHADFLQKPVTPSRLAEKIRMILDATAGAARRADPGSR